MALGTLLPARLAAAGAGGDIYIAPTGDDSTGDGTIGDPYETPERAAADAGPGDIIHCRGGTYGSFSQQDLGIAGNAGAPIQIRAYLAESPVFPQTNRWSLAGADYLRVGPGLRLTGAAEHMKIDAGATNIEVVGNEFETSEEHCILITGSTGPIQIWDNEFSGDGLNNQDHLVYFSSTLGVCVVANNVFRDHGGGYGLQAYPNADGLVVVCNTFYEFPDRSPIVIGGDEGAATQNLRAVGNIVVGGGNAGVHVLWEGPVGSAQVSDTVAFDNGGGDVQSASGVVYTNVVHANPLFDNAGGGDFHISSDSSPAKALVPSSREGWVPALDKDGNARQTADAGAYAVGEGGAPPPPPDQPPQNVTVPTVSGTPVDGETLTGSDGTWANGTTGFTYRWMRCNAAGTSCAAIGGETGPTYDLAPADIGSTIRFEVTATNAEGSTVATSAATAVVGGVSGGSGAPVNTVAPSISGVYQQGRVLTAGPGTWTGDTPMTFSYQWVRCNSDGSGCVEIPSATGQTRLVSATDVGKKLRVDVVASN